MLCFGSIFAHGSTTKANRPNSLGLEQVYTNNNAYLFGIPVDGTMIDGDHYTNIRFQPYNTMDLYTETVLFCGDVRSAFGNAYTGEPYKGPMVITYDKIAHHMYQGIGCHDMVSVFEVHDDQVSVKP
jgi:hypothetical protein